MTVVSGCVQVFLVVSVVLCYVVLCFAVFDCICCAVLCENVIKKVHFTFKTTRLMGQF